MHMVGRACLSSGKIDLVCDCCAYWDDFARCAGLVAKALHKWAIGYAQDVGVVRVHAG